MISTLAGLNAPAKLSRTRKTLGFLAGFSGERGARKKVLGAAPRKKEKKSWLQRLQGLAPTEEE